MDERRGKVVCHLRRADGRELSLGGHHRGKYVGRRNHYCS